MNDTPEKRIEEKWRREMNTSQDLTIDDGDGDRNVNDDRLINTYYI